MNTVTAYTEPGTIEMWITIEWYKPNPYEYDSTCLLNILN